MFHAQVAANCEPYADLKHSATSLGMMSDEEKKMQRIEDIKELLS